MGDLSPLAPLSLRDVIWLQADEWLEQREKLELKKSELSIERERAKVLFTLISDLRHIQLSKMYFKSDVAYKDFLTTLPSYKGDAKADKEKRRWKVTRRKPGEIPEWKRKRQAEQETETKQ